MDLAKPKHDAMERHGRRDLMYLEHHIHSLEIEAYSSVLKAFIAQSDLLSWGKEGLISDLRKELNVTDAEHGAILIAVNSDESVKRIREQRTLPTHAENCVKVNNPRHGSGSVQNSSIMMKTSSPFAYLPQKNMLLCQSSHAAFPIPSSVPVEKMLFDGEKLDPIVVDKAKCTLRVTPVNQGARKGYT
ncbi:protein EMSY-LIKE 4-like isoform X8 [Prosopis cineraria]|uniref:protein EMSY-LIKE 4-like isoform X8 n=1 Tax=Prosopis cineraria TaxID=364024 RepID=UPI00240FD42B|nr:protein EMSY-LIKE 4-like isoform X8 [Prosopis cineraria]